MVHHPRILAVGSAHPAYHYSQHEMLHYAQRQLLGEDWAAHPQTARRGEHLAQLFTAAHVQQRQFAVSLDEYYAQPRTVGERMADFQRLAPPLAHAALTSALAKAAIPASAIADFITVSCTGYAAPGLDVVLARDLAMPREVRRVNVGHMGCYGAMVGLRQALATTRAYPGSTAAVLCTELTGLHFMPTDDEEVLTSFALFGDAAAAVVLRDDPTASGPELVEATSLADFASADQMSWTITDQGFVMTLSPRVPVTLRRNIGTAMERLLAPQNLTTRDITHWLVHPGGPSILEAIERKLTLTPEQMAISWQMLRDHGNCSSATVLLILEELMRSGTPKHGEWGVMMAFGPGLTLEACLLRF